MDNLYKDIQEGKLEELDLDYKFRFSCLQCGFCCTNNQDVFLTPYDIYRWRKKFDILTINLIKNGVYESVTDINSLLPVCKMKFVRIPEVDRMVCPFIKSIYIDDKEVGRNDPCPCGSGNKYKKCCEEHNGKFYCEIWETRPTLCRLYPMGSIIKWDKKSDEYKISYYFVGDICKGMFGPHHKLEDWVEDEEVKKSLDYGLKYTQLLKKIADKKIIIEEDKKYTEVVANVLYNYDNLNYLVNKDMEFEEIWKVITDYIDGFIDKPEDYIS